MSLHTYIYVVHIVWALLEGAWEQEFNCQRLLHRNCWAYDKELKSTYQPVHFSQCAASCSFRFVYLQYFIIYKKTNPYRPPLVHWKISDLVCVSPWWPSHSIQEQTPNLHLQVKGKYLILKRFWISLSKVYSTVQSFLINTNYFIALIWIATHTWWWCTNSWDLFSKPCQWDGELSCSSLSQHSSPHNTSLSTVTVRGHRKSEV